MKFKNELEEQAYLITKEVFGATAAVTHNKVIRIERALVPAVAAFSGPPKKEIDVLTAELLKSPKVDLLISCKQFEGKAEPAHVQEWGAVLKTMNEYADQTTYLGLVLCPTGFTKGCEPWATSANIALIPPLKGKLVTFPPSTSLKMFKRALSALKKRLSFPFDDLLIPPGFYDFVYGLTADYEGLEEVTVEYGDRYLLVDTRWRSSFGELIRMLIGKKILKVVSTTEHIGLGLEDNYVFLYSSDRILFGVDKAFQPEVSVTPTCRKNLSFQDCSFDFVQQLISGQEITSAADFGAYFEFGLGNEINLGFHPNNLLHVICTKNPLKDNEL